MADHLERIKRQLPRIINATLRAREAAPGAATEIDHRDEGRAKGKAGKVAFEDTGKVVAEEKK